MRLMTRKLPATRAASPKTAGLRDFRLKRIKTETSRISAACAGFPALASFVLGACTRKIRWAEVRGSVVPRPIQSWILAIVSAIPLFTWGEGVPACRLAFRRTFEKNTRQSRKLFAWFEMRSLLPSGVPYRLRFREKKPALITDTIAR